MPTNMIRKQIYLHKRHIALLKRLSRQRGVSESEIIRQAIDREEDINQTGFRPMDRQQAIKESVAFALSLRERDFPGEPYKFNREELYKERENRWFRKDPDQKK